MTASRDLSDGAVQRIDENPVVREFFDLPTHESRFALILADEWRDSVIFESFGRGFADRKAGAFIAGRLADGTNHLMTLSTRHPTCWHKRRRLCPSTDT